MVCDIIHKVEKECSSCALEGLREGAAGSPESHAVVRDGYLKQAILSRVKNSMGKWGGLSTPSEGHHCAKGPSLSSSLRTTAGFIASQALLIFSALWAQECCLCCVTSGK